MPGRRWRTKEELKDDFFSFFANHLYLNKDVGDWDFYAKDGNFIIKRYPLLGKVKGVRKKVIVFDLDDTLTEPGYKKALAYNVFEAAAEVNTRIRKYLESKGGIFEIIGRIVKKAQNVLMPSFDKEKRDLTKLLRGCNFTKQEYLDACRTGADRTIPITNCEETLSILEELGFVPFVDTASPSPASVRFVEKKLLVLPTRIRGSTFFFDKHGKIRDIEINIAQHKVIDKDEIIKREKCFPDCWVLVSDDFRADKYLASTVGMSLCVWIPGKEEVSRYEKLPGRISIYEPKVREDMLNLIPLIRKYELARVFTFFKQRTT
jgi:FMN phosphatase YigB (HAD superfamily)